MSIDAVRDMASWTERHGLGTDPVSIGGFTSPDYYRLEVERLWKQTWVEVGRLSQISCPGDFFVIDLPGLDASILVVRAADGRVMAFHNICTHRCNRLVTEDRGAARAFACAYHGWTYRLDGSLGLITDEASFFDIDKNDYGLVPVHVDTWEDFVFINLANDPSETLTEYLGDFATGLAGYPFTELTHEYAWSADLECNWKLIQDSFLESYHLGILHRESAGAASVSPRNPYAHPLNFALTKYHSACSLVGNLEYVPPPMAMMAVSTGIASIADGMKLAHGDSSPPAINPTGGADWQGELISVFPSAVLVCFGDFFLHFNWRPLAVDRCRFEVRQCVRSPRNATERWAQEVAAGSLYATVLEDISTVENIQANMMSGVRKSFVLQDHEIQIRNAHHWCQQFVGRYPEV